MNKFSKKINLLVMPTDECNMNCIYCFHSPHHEKNGKMSLETLEKLYEITFKDYSEVSIIWHGGEPLLMGLEFYKEAINKQKKYSHIKIENRMQSNLTLLTDDFADFLCENNISIGASFDGIMNEKLRGNTEKILDARNKLIQRNKTCGFIMVLSQKNIDTLIDSYEFFKKIKANYTFNTYVSTPSIINNELELEPTYTAKRIIEFFDYWLHDYNSNIHVDYFERIIRFIVTGEKSVCKYNSCLGKWMGIRYNGDIVPCNRFFPKQYYYGNIWEYDMISSAFKSEGFKRILSEAIERREKCKNCVAFSICSGGCNNVAYNENGIENNGGSSCLIFKTVYRYIVRRIIALCKMSEYNSCYNPNVISIINSVKRNNKKNFHYDFYNDIDNCEIY